MSQSMIDNRYMEMRIGEQLYCVPLLSVREVIQKPEVTTVPNSPPDFEGMMNLRGQILGVFNVKKKLGAKVKVGTTLDTTPIVVVIEDRGVSVGIIVDEVTRVLSPEANMVKAAPLRDDDPTKKFIDAVIQTGEDLVLILNLENFLELNKYKTFLKAS